MSCLLSDISLSSLTEMEAQQVSAMLYFAVVSYLSIHYDD